MIVIRSGDGQLPQFPGPTEAREVEVKALRRIAKANEAAIALTPRERGCAQSGAMITPRKTKAPRRPPAPGLGAVRLSNRNDAVRLLGINGYFISQLQGYREARVDFDAVIRVSGIRTSY